MIGRTLSGYQRSFLTSDAVHLEMSPVLFGPAQSSKTRDLPFSFVKGNWAALIAQLPLDYGAFVRYVAAGYSDESHRSEVESFFSGRSTYYSGGLRVLAQVRGARNADAV